MVNFPSNPLGRGGIDIFFVRGRIEINERTLPQPVAKANPDHNKDMTDENCVLVTCFSQPEA